MFEIGKKVVCIAAGWRLSLDEPRNSAIGPRKHEVIELLEIAMSDDPIAGLCLHLKGYEVCGNDRKNWYSAVNFRPIEGFPDFSNEIENIEQQERIEILQPDYA